MILTCKKFGQLNLEIQVNKSSVDSHVLAAYNDDRDLTEEELEWLDNEYSAEIQEYAYLNGSRNHN